MDEPKDPQPAADSRPPLVAAHTRLSPMQEAWGTYAHHRLHCHQCADVDADPCPTSGRLYREWEAIAKAAARRLAGGVG
ncbi:hypothetical protein [Streptomyces sp. NPDC037389]|uniref:hypothetical protein n=2 Tax=Streptomyces TaxID=1883 RepID=UPI003410FDB9